MTWLKNKNYAFYNENFSKIFKIFDYFFTVVKCLPWTNEVTTTLQPGNEMTVVGLGHLSFGGEAPNVLQEVNLKMMSNSDCNRRFKNELVKTGMHNNTVPCPLCFQKCPQNVTIIVET